MRGDTRVYAWAHACTAEEVTQLLSGWGGRLGVVLYKSAWSAARDKGSFIAFLGSEAQAYELIDEVAAGAHFEAAILMDEQNGKVVTSAYLRSAVRVRDLLEDAGVPFWGMSTMGISSGPDWSFLKAERAQLALPRLCWNSSGSRGKIVKELNRLPLAWLLSPHPWRFTLWPPFDSGWLNWVLDHLHGRTARWYARLALERPDIKVAFWCLRTYETGHFGLHRRDGSLTRLGQAVRQVLS